MRAEIGKQAWCVKLYLMSSKASGTTRISGCSGSRVHAQKEALLSVEFTGKPWTLLNHCLSFATSETMATGTWKMLHNCKKDGLLRSLKEDLRQLC